eukprot:CAMPEP_0178402848 /NCGR_PEP_ID=MMETSP0689_2-20121128/17062_1 /TAXON_ID=160604 /ORGANISM="Amphidinium massartii, Strain CS-259" /LENGTH=625 /DNA_ID=CAMNT_0020023779 /DNA_START=125 /DNA_END=1999 /DNA_ORIENTATION=+
MGCMLVANKFIADVKVDEKRKAMSGPGLAQYLHWRGASLSLSLSLWIFAILFNSWEVQNRYYSSVKDSISNHAKLMFYYVNIAAIGIMGLGVCASSVAYGHLAMSWTSRRTDFMKSVKMARKAYVLDVTMVILAYVVIPLALFFSENMLRRDLCMWTITNISLFGPISRQAFSTAAAMSGDAALAAEFQKETSLHQIKRGWAGGGWLGRDWCNANPGWLEMIFGPDPSVMPMNPAAYHGAGMIPTVTHLLEGMTGARCPQQGFQMGSLAAVIGGFVPQQTDQTANLTSFAEEGCATEANPLDYVGKMSGMQDYVCMFKEGMSVTAMSIRITLLLTTNVVGFYCAFLAFSKVFPPCSSLLRAFSHACLNVKNVMPMSSLPGYLLLTAVCMFIPPMCLNMVFFNQIAAHPLFAVGVFFLMVFEAYEFMTGSLMTEPMPFQRFMTKFKPLNTRRQVVRVLAIVCILGWVINFLYHTGSFGRIWAAMRLENISLSFPATFAMITSFFFHRNFSTMVYTDYIFFALFDTEDDLLQKKSKERKLNAAEALRSWYRLCQDEAKLLALLGEGYDAPQRPKPKPKPFPKGLGKSKFGKGASPGDFPGGSKGKGKTLMTKGPAGKAGGGKGKVFR